MQKIHIPLISLWFVALLSCASTGESMLKDQSDSSSKIIAMSSTVINSSERSDAGKAASDMYNFVTSLSKSEIEGINNSSMDAIASLLRNENDAVVYFAAKMLGSIGPQARRTLPALRQALKAATPQAGSGEVAPSVSPRDAIGDAITAIEL